MKMKIQALYLTGTALLIGAAGVGDSVTFDTVGSWTGAVILAVLLAAGGIVCWGYGRGLEIERAEKAQLRRYCRKLKSCQRAAEMTRWCILIALHQSFGVGAARLNKILARAEKLGQESLDVAMTVNDRGMPSTDRSLALRRSWMPEGVDPDFRVPVLRSPRTRREEQLRMAGDVAASMVWTLCAEACIEELGFGAGRLNRLKEEALANYRQVNEEGHADGLDVAMEHLRRCAQDALKEEVVVDNQPDEDRVKRSERDYEEQKQAFLKRAVMQALGRRAGKGSLRILSEKKLEEKATAAMAQLKESRWAKRISTP